MALSVIAVALALPLGGSALVGFAGRKPNLRDGITFVVAGLLFAAVCSLVPAVWAGERPSLVLVGDMLPGVPLAFEVEPLGLLFALVASGLWIVTHAYAIGYMRGHHEENQTRFFVCFAVAIFAAVGAAFSANMLTLFVFYEVLTLSTYPLVTHHGTPEARRAGRIYLGILLFTSVALLLLAVIWTYTIAGTLDFRPGGVLAGKTSPAMLGVLLGLYVLGTGKAAVMPFHLWLPNAMVAPTPVSALLHAVAVVKTGVFTVLKVVVYIFGLENLQASGANTWLCYLAGFTILAASLVAMTKDDLKARLAFSTVSQLSYIVLGAALATPRGFVGGGTHILMHAFGKITLFFCAGAIYVAAHKKKISEMHGLGRRMPITYAAFAIGALSVIGLPPAGGAWSKWLLGEAALEAGQIPLLFVLGISSLLNVWYLGIVFRDGMFPRVAEGEAPPPFKLKEAPLFCLVPLCLTALGCLVLFFYAQPVEALLLRALGGGP